ncbi:MAG: hypothetical protein KDD60_13295, partial [Bdellovibrionales bacterium]|nr:hypothetical protein [Bdellovibrionales bacterium]
DDSDDSPIPIDEVDQQAVTDTGTERSNPKKAKRCVGGHVKIDGDDYVVDCKGDMFRSQEGLEP